MFATEFRALFIFALCLISACEGTMETEPKTDHAELAEMYRVDQAVRTGDMQNWAVISENDRRRRERVQVLLASDSLQTANDYYHAAMIFQHGEDSTAYRMARELAQQAVALDSTHGDALWMTAAAGDRYLLSVGEPQHYGTQFMIYLDMWYLQRIDTAAVTDAERRRVGTRTLDEIEAFLAEQNGEPRGLNIVPDSVLIAMGKMPPD
jgi:hypothetical protein